MNYTEQDLIKIGKRDNNTKRSFLLVDPLQGKHIPAVPSETFRLMRTLAETVYPCYKDSPLLIIGFAETATALGAILASCAPFPVNYIHTTREVLPEHQYLFFSEAHSHATEQKLVKDVLDSGLEEHTRILFAEDEVTTGNTIENIMQILTKTYPHLHLEFSIVSILNGMPESRIAELRSQNIGVHYLQRVPGYNYTEILDAYTYASQLTVDCRESEQIPCLTLASSQASDPRCMVSIKDYLEECTLLSRHIITSLPEEQLLGKHFLVLGTEECMYPGLHFAHFLEQQGTCASVHFHATTRSPILPDEDEGYPLHKRYVLTSFYEDSRTTYIYNLKHYDSVIVITDAPQQGKGLSSLCRALALHGCGTILCCYANTSRDRGTE